MPTSSLRFDEPFVTLACPRCKTARARPAPIKTPGYGVAFARAFVTALDGSRAKAGRHREGRADGGLLRGRVEWGLH